MSIKALLMLVLSLSTACTTLVSNTVSRENQIQARSFFEAGVSLFTEERYPESLRAFEEATRHHPKHPSYEMHKALALFYLGRREVALEHIKMSCALSDDFPECHNNESLLLLEMDRPEEALISAQKALAITTFRNPERALKNLGRAYYKMQRFEEAESSFNEALNKPGSQRFCDIRLLRSQSLLALTRFQEALREAQTSRNLCETEPATHFWLAYTQYRLAQMSEAESTLQNASRLFRDPQVRMKAEEMKMQLIREEHLAEPNILL
jgi:tetratricopeptide (TPR) repeat protein